MKVKSSSEGRQQTERSNSSESSQRVSSSPTKSEQPRAQPQESARNVDSFETKAPRHGPALSPPPLPGSSAPTATYSALSTGASRGPANPNRPASIADVNPIPAGQPGSMYGVPYDVAGGVSVNGRLGAHWPVQFDVRNSQQVDSIISKMSELGAGYTTINIDPGHLEANKEHYQQLFDKLKNHNPPITPVVRIYEGESPDKWEQPHIDRMVNAAVELGRMGVGLIQVGNEPNIETKLEDRARQDGVLGDPAELARRKQKFLEDSIPKQAEAMAQIKSRLVDEGLADRVKIGLPPMAAGSNDENPFTFAPDTYFKALVGGIKAREDVLNQGRAAEGKQPIQTVDWLATHTYLWDEGPNNPAVDSPRSGGARGMMGWGPNTASQYEAWARDTLGYSPRSLSTEGGAAPGSFREDNTARVERELTETYAQLNNNPSATGSLWLDWESVKDSNTWDRSVFIPQEGQPADGAWRDVLPDYRDAYRRATGG